ncbi:MAG: polysaccharide deacetylase family protein [Bacteroidales bacterium]|nr:polysaccharide deacetylase family protein [Bacteroidales bacterium]
MSELTARIPDNNVEERKYIISVLFRDFLHTEPPQIEVADTDCTTLLYDDKKIVFRDHFWNAHPEHLSYLDICNLPKPTFINSKFFWTKGFPFLFGNDEYEIPILYGNDEFEAATNLITCGIDIWASVYFMLTRWEEYVNPTRDEHGRFPASASTALKHNFLHLPVVNLYAELLNEMLRNIGYYPEDDENCNDGNDILEKTLIPTHDIDILQSNPKWKSIGGDILKRHDLKMALHRLFTFRDPLDCYDYLMDKSEHIGTKSIFFFMAADHREGYSDNYLNTKKFTETIEKIKKRGHIIGFHAGHGTADNPERYTEELQLLRQHTGVDITFSRQHFLKFDMPNTFNMLEANGITHDFSLGYSDSEGFRCGTGNSYQVFDFLARKTLNVREVPLIIMDSTLNHTKHLSTAQAEELFENYIPNYTPVSILFHNSSFDNYTWKGWKKLYDKIINQSLIIND